MARCSTKPSRARAVLALSLVWIACSATVARNEGIRWADALKQKAGWYATPEARAIADSVLGYQEPSGGWPKNIDMTVPRGPGATADRPEATIDNQATFTQIRYLARVHAASPDPRYRDAVLRGIDYLLAAQYPNGGWPQFYPLRTDYSRYITFNDDAMIGVMRLLDDIASQSTGWAFVDGARKAKARDALRRGVDVILRSQVRVNGRLTVWCAQHDEVTLEPRKARAYEHVSLSGEESVGIVRFLMSRTARTPPITAAVEGAVAWLDQVKLRGWRLEQRADQALPGGFDRVMVRDEQAPPLWARFYEIGTNRPIFSGRDGVIRHSLAEIEHERRVGYSWVGDWPRTLLETEYPQWRARKSN